MKGAPGFKKFSDTVDGKWKVELLRWLHEVTGIDVLIETGTCHGFTPWSLHNDFRKILTIELHKGLYEGSVKRLSEIKNVIQYFGSSKEWIGDMIAKAESDRILFWLDAHSSGPQTADDGDPLPYELDVITSYCPKALIVIDDMADEHLRHITDAGVDLSGWHREYRTGEIIMYREGEYSIPPFEASDEN